MKKKTTLLVLITLIMTVVLTACGPGRQKAAPEANNNGSSKAAASDVVKVSMVLKNKTGSDLHRLYVSGSGREGWGDEILRGTVLKNDNQLTLVLTVDKNNLKWDIKAYDSDGTSVEFRNLDISAVSTDGGTITLSKEGDGYYAKAE